MAKRTKAFVWILLVFISLCLPTLSLLNQEQWSEILSPLLIGTIAIAWLGFNRVEIARNDSVTFIHAISLLIGLTLGPYPAILATTCGVILALIAERFLKRCNHVLHCAKRGLVICSRQLIALAGGVGLYLTLGGQRIYRTPSLPEAFPTIALAITFSLLYVSVHAVQRWLRSARPITRTDSILVSLIALIPIPIVVIGTVAYSVFAETALIIYSATIVFSAPAFRALIEMQNELAGKTRSLNALFDLATERDLTADENQNYALIDLALSELALSDYAALLLQETGDQQPKLVHTYNIPSDKLGNLKLDENFLLDAEIAARTTIEPIYVSMDADLPASFQTFARHLEIEQAAVLTIEAEDSTIGQLWLFFKNRQPLDADELEQLRVFNKQLSKSISFSREFAATNTELRRRVEQLARLESIGRQVTASIDIEDVYQTIMYHGLQATSATMGNLELLNTQTEELESVAFENDISLQKERNDLSAEAIHALTQRAFETGQVTNVLDTRSEPEFETLESSPLSLLITPIISQGETIGVITLGKSEVGGFTPEEEAFLIQLSSQAANALRNAMMYEELEERLREQSLLYQASAQIAESLDTEAVSLALADSLAFTVNARAAYIYRYSAGSNELNFIIGVDGKSTLDARKDAKSLELQIPGVIACLEDRRPIQWTLSNPPTEVDAAHLTSLGGETILLLPLIVGERTLGLVELIRNKDALFEEEELRTAQSIAIQASIILENSDLFQQISQSNNRLSAVLNSTREGMLMIDKEGKIAVVNNQLKELININPDLLTESTFLGSDDEIIQRLGYKPKEIEDLISSLRSGEGHLPGISTYELSQDERRVLRRLETPVHDSSGRLIGWLLVIRDVSEEMQLEESRKHLTEMIVHDLRSPLSAILNSMELLKMQLEGQDQSPILQQALAISDRSVHQMLGLVNALLDLSKLESGQFVLAANEINFHELIPHLIDTFLPEAEQAGVILDYHVDPEIGEMTLDEEKIFRVLSNLVDNALKFTPAGGKITLDMKRMDDQLFIDVRDTGPGVPSEYREQIFDLYAQVPGTEGRRRGTGLGLAFCKLAIEAHQGEIWVEDNPGGGSRFRIRLPVNNKAKH
ncbi:MAG: ATP-binding protein [Anaerolineales bacterium]|jgi:signal transduction histidine kinase